MTDFREHTELWSDEIRNPIAVRPMSDANDGLAHQALTEYRLSYTSAVNALEHALACGEILLRIQSTVPDGKWGAWCATNVPEINPTTVTKFCRLAQYRNELAAGGYTTIDQAMGHLRALSIPRRPTGARRRPRKLDVDEARKLHKQGLNYEQIGDVFDVSGVTVAIHLDPARRAAMQERQRQRHKRMKAAKVALAAAERDEAVKRKGGTPADAYAMLRKTALVIDKAIAESTDPAARSRLMSALGFCHKSEDEIVAALQIGRTG